MGIIDGLIDIAGGVWNVAKGAGKIIWGAFKLALLAAILPIVGLYMMAEGIFNYAKRKYREFKTKRPETKVKGAGSITGKPLGNAIRNAEQKIGDSIDLSEFEKEDAKKDLNEIKNKLESGEIDGMQYIDGKNENGEDEILDAELFKASSIDSDSKDKNIYRPFNNA